MRTYIWIRGTIINAIYHQVRSTARFDRPPCRSRYPARAVPSPTFLISFNIYLIVLLLPSAVIYSLICLLHYPVIPQRHVSDSVLRTRRLSCPRVLLTPRRAGGGARVVPRGHPSFHRRRTHSLIPHRCIATRAVHLNCMIPANTRRRSQSGFSGFTHTSREAVLSPITFYRSPKPYLPNASSTPLRRPLFVYVWWGSREPADLSNSAENCGPLAEADLQSPFS